MEVLFSVSTEGNEMKQRTWHMYMSPMDKQLAVSIEKPENKLK